jgi:hypothetical protein
MNNSELVEYYGFKAHKVGKFKEWQNVSSSLRQESPQAEIGDLAEQAYNMVVGSI